MLKLPRTIKEGGQLSLYVNTPERQAVLARLVEGMPDARSVSDAVFQALEEWERYADVGRASAPFFASLSRWLAAMREAFPPDKDEDARAGVYALLVSQLLVGLADELGEHQKELLGRQLTEEELRSLRKGATDSLTYAWKAHQPKSETMLKLLGAYTATSLRDRHLRDTLLHMWSAKGGDLEVDEEEE